MNFGFANGGMRYPGDLHSAHAGKKLPIAKIPAGLAFKPGQESIHAGKASFSQLRYGRYLSGMSTTKEKSFMLPTPVTPAQAPELVSGKSVALTGQLPVGPRSTVGLDLGEGKN